MLPMINLMDAVPLPISAPVDAALLHERPARWPWVLGILAVAATWAVLTIVAGWHLIYFESTDDAVYTAWVYAPEAHACLVGCLVALCGVVPMSFQRPGRRLRLTVVVVAVTASLMSWLVGLHESSARRHLGAALTEGVAGVTVAGGTPAGPIVDEGSPGFAGVTLAIPERSRSWSVPGQAESVACVAVQRTAGPHWQQVGTTGCRYILRRGRIGLTIDTGEATASGRWTVIVTAGPAFGYWPGASG
jgi:hypothetical protein